MTFRISHVLGASALALCASAAAADQVFNDDVIIQGSLCVGFDCVNGESFDFDTVRLKENNLRMHFDDTSSSSSFPANDWRITINDSANGGSSYFRVSDTTAGRDIFTIGAAAPSNSLVVESGTGDVGLGTTSPVLELHVSDGDSPGLRLEQNGSSGFTPQTWDIAGNETNFFVRDATNGSSLPFRIRAGADSNAIYIDSDNDVFVGLAGTDSYIGDLVVGGAGVKLLDLVSTDNGPAQYRMITDSGNRRFVALNSSGDVEAQMIFNNSEIGLAGANDSSELWATINTNGIALPAGATFSVNGTDLTVPDYVFGEDYELMPLTELAAFIDTNSHLPRVPSAADVRANGLDITGMQLTLLEKVEELTLYTLTQERELKGLRQRLEVLEN